MAYSKLKTKKVQCRRMPNFNSQVEMSILNTPETMEWFPMMGVLSDEQHPGLLNKMLLGTVTQVD